MPERSVEDVSFRIWKMQVAGFDPVEEQRKPRGVRGMPPAPREIDYSNAPAAEARRQPAVAEPARRLAKPYGGTSPTADHSWKQRYDGMQTPGSSKRPAGTTETVLAIPSATP